MTTIHPIRTSVVRSYLIVEEGAILVDCGPPGQAKKIERQLGRLTVDPTDVTLIVLTHSHADHAGCVNELRELTGARIVVGSADRGWLEQGVVAVPTPTNAWGKFVAATFKALMLPFVQLPAAEADIFVEDEDLDLAPYGVNGRVLATPGHTPGSLTVLLHGGDAIVGDMAMSGPPFASRPGLPFAAEDTEALLKSWRELLRRGAKTIYPAHGKPFPADVMRALLAAKHAL